MPPPYPVFEPGITPHTKAAATAQSWRGVKNAAVIEVVGARYRNCRPITDTSALVTPDDRPEPNGGKPGIEVACSWLGAKPPTKYPGIIVTLGNFRIRKGYSGKVMDNIRA
ncbi:MAG TPA: hypothetical protein VLZ76_06780 [Lysobacter sp.]|nr:hypothetical protein [Lysobacter sp.]